MPFPARIAISALLAVQLILPATADVVINEIMANGSERLLRWSPAGVPTLGFWTPWQSEAFNDASWQTGAGPFGFGTFTNVAPMPTFGTNTATQMQNLTPTMYLRKTFTVSATDAAKTDPLTFTVQFNDGFVAYLNGVEVARRNAGPMNAFLYHDQFAAFSTPANTEISTTPYARSATLNLGAANTKLLTGTNTLAIQALNYWEASVVYNTSTLAFATIDNKNNFLFKGDLVIGGASPVSLVLNNTTWRYFPGVAEPSGGTYDPTLLFSAKQTVPWGRPSFEDTTWLSGAAPIGGGTPPGGVILGTNLTGLLVNQASSVYARIVFTASAADIADPLAVQLLMDYDDSFVAYFNGVEVARDRLGLANTFTPHNAVADSARTPGSYATYNLDPPAKLLIQGQNVLAVQIHNVSLNDADLFFRAQVRTNSAGINHTLVTATSTWKYLIGTDEPLVTADEATEDNPEAPDSSLDWLELHNNGASAVALADWGLSDEPGKPMKWKFPTGTSLPAGGHLLIACDGLDANYTGSGGLLHTSLKLNSGGETLTLTTDTGITASQVTYPAQTPFQSYGRDGLGSYLFYESPTPGAANAGITYTSQVAAPVMSVAAGFYPSARTVALTCATPGATIRHTTDGSEPTETTGSTASSATVSTSSALRARAFKVGSIPSPTTTRTYLIAESANRQALPALCISGDQGRSLYQPFGIMAIKGGAFTAFVNPPDNIGQNSIWTQTGSSVGSAADLTAYNNPIHRGRFMERPATMELLRANGTPGPNVAFGMRISGSGHARPRYKLTNQNSASPNAGAWSATDFTQKPSFNFFFRDDLGGDPLDYALFPGYPVTQFHDLRIRAGKNDLSNPFIEDEYMRRLFINTGQVGSRGLLNTLYVNGVYKGYYNLCEHLREDFMQRHHHSDFAWDVRQVNVVTSGDGLAFQEMITFLRNNSPSTLANYQAMKTRLDMVNFIDYLIVNVLGVTGDWPHNNFVAARERSTSGLYRYYLWDAEGAFGDFGGNVRSNPFDPAATASIVTTSQSTAGLDQGIRILYTYLRVSPEFRLLFADRLQRHFFNGGALTEANALAEFNTLKSEFAPVIAPTAVTDRVTPWLNGVGDATRYTLSGGATGSVVNSPSRRNVLFAGYDDDTIGGPVPAHFAAEGLWTTLLPPTFSTFGGTVAPGSTLTIGNTNGGGTIIYYTTNGLDPRAEGGAIQGAAYASPIVIHFPTTVRARVRTGSGVWSPLTEATFEPGTVAPLLISEVMYHPPDIGLVSGDEYEFVEIKNTGTQTVTLAGMRFTAGLDYTFPGGTTIGPGQLKVLARNSARFLEKYPAVTPLGQWGQDSTLSDGGETLTLTDASNHIVFTTTYFDSQPWPQSADGDGPSIVPVNPNSNPSPNNASFWRASTNNGGSPGTDDPAPAVPTIHINELIANPLTSEFDRVELFNPNATPVDVGDWWLSDNASIPQKYRIPTGTVIPTDGYVVFTESDFNAGANPFGFASEGEEVRLSSGDITGALTGWSQTWSFGASESGVSFGRYVNSQGAAFLTRQRYPTFGSANAGPAIGPVIITELLPHPAGGGEEFLEIRNTSTAPVPLYDPNNPGNAWRIDGLCFSFPPGQTLQPGQIALIVPSVPSVFRSTYGIPAAIAIYGPYGGALNNAGERLSLQKPVSFLGPAPTYTDIDFLTYSPAAPWPTTASGTGRSLERVNPGAFGDDPLNWTASATSAATPGTPRPLTYAAWCALYFTPSQIADPTIGAVTADADGDGLSNFREWAAGTDPWTPNASPVTFSIENATAPRYLNLTLRRNLAATGLGTFADTGADLLGGWTLGGGVQTGSPINNGDGTETLTFRDATALGTVPRHHLRLRLTAP